MCPIQDLSFADQCRLAPYKEAPPKALKELCEKYRIKQHGRGGTGGTSTSKAGASGGETRKDGFSNLKRKMSDRRDDDKERSWKRRDPSDKRTFGREKARPTSMLCFAYDITDGQFYIGYSGGASDVDSHSVHEVDRTVRQNRVAAALVDVSGGRENWSIYNCAEIAALNVALSHGALVQNLIFATMNDQYQFHPLCGHCRQWVPVRSFGWIDSNGFQPGHRMG